MIGMQSSTTVVPPLAFHSHSFTEPLFFHEPETYVRIWLDDNWSFSVAALLGLFILCGVYYIKSPWRYVPPGPSGLPILGNIREVRDQRWLFSPDCRQKHGDLIYLNVLGQPILILNTQEVAADLLDHRANIYSDRPRLILGNEIYAGGNSFTLGTYGDTWRRRRRAVHNALSPTAVKGFHDVQRKEAILLASSILATPDRRNAHFRRVTASMTLSVIFDFPTIKSDDDADLLKIEEHIERHSTATISPIALLVEALPWMRYVPSWTAKWKREAEEWYEHDSVMFEGMVKKVQAKLDHDSDRMSLTASLLEDEARAGLSERERAWLTGGVYAAGSETTTVTLQWWTLAMVAYPETQRRAQAELDAVVGRSRPPALSDIPHLPYIQAMVKEVLRWRSSLALGLPHRLMEDDWYRGMFIPKGTVCVANVPACNRDPEIYGADAEHFNPARYLNADGSISADAKGEGHVTYGFGKRICVGRHLANNTLAIDFAVMLWAATFEAARDANGEQIPLDLDNYGGIELTSRPHPFDGTVAPRFSEVLTILAEERDMIGA